MIPVRPEHLKTTPVPMLLRPSADHAATGVKTVRQARLTGTVLMSVLQNAVAAILVPIPVLPAQRAVFPVPETTSPRVFLQPNAVPAVMNADIILIVTLLLNLVIMVVLPQTLAVSALPASLARRWPIRLTAPTERKLVPTAAVGHVPAARQHQLVLPDIQERDVPITILCEFYKKMRSVVAVGYVLTDGMIVGAELVKENAKMQVITAKKWKDAFRVRYVMTGRKINKMDDTNQIIDKKRHRQIPVSL